jgi:hypothetical protein
VISWSSLPLEHSELIQPSPKPTCRLISSSEQPNSPKKLCGHVCVTNGHFWYSIKSPWWVTPPIPCQGNSGELISIEFWKPQWNILSLQHLIKSSSPPSPKYGSSSGITHEDNLDGHVRLDSGRLSGCRRKDCVCRSGLSPPKYRASLARVYFSEMSLDHTKIRFNRITPSKWGRIYFHLDYYTFVIVLFLYFLK